MAALALLLHLDPGHHERERIFSLMNDLKTVERSRLSEKLSSLMVWHVAGRTMPCCDVPILDILQEFRALAGIRGRYAHRGGISRPCMTTRQRSRTLTEDVVLTPATESWC